MNGSETLITVVAGIGVIQAIGGVLQLVGLFKKTTVSPEIEKIENTIAAANQVAGTKLDALHRRMDEMRDTLIVMPCRDHSERLAYLEGKTNGNGKGKVRARA
jgi:hypothetical protein